LKNDEEYLHSNPSRFHVNRLTKYEIAYERYRRLKDIQIWLIIREALTYLCFLIFLCVIVYSNRDSNSSLQVQHLRNYFSNSKTIGYEYSQVSTIDEYWKWLEKRFIWDLRAQDWYNKQEPRNLSGFIDDKTNRLIGWATMRQLRIKSHLYLVQTVHSTCEGDYSSSNEEKESLYPKWKTSFEEEYSPSIMKSFKYQSAKELDIVTFMSVIMRHITEVVMCMNFVEV
jgi:hypothetical protein